MKKSEGRFGEGKWNGLGGKVKPGESPVECARREVLEESGLTLGDVKPRGRLTFSFQGKEDWVVHVFSSTSFEGEPVASDEGILRWFPDDSIPYDEMWPDDRHWVPFILEGSDFEGHFDFDGEGKRILGFDLSRVSDDRNLDE
jgi:8-oxo-dGTP pyrophosphatase MutT (NUDIX family)